MASSIIIDKSIASKKSNFTYIRQNGYFLVLKKKPSIFTSISPPPFPKLQPTTSISEILVYERGSGTLPPVCRPLNPSKGGAKGEKGGCSKEGDEIGCKYAGTRGWAWTRGTAPCVVGTCRVGHGCHSRTNIRGIYPWSASAYPEYHIQYQPSYPCEASPFPRSRE